ncbi:hypothetical protein [Flavobacterium sp. IMCC34518]|uniref:hypothetical protein n=1 Tax=Flavobacterium sp. IMCC34518 TaxID=3003623 RepID=UPI0022ABF8FF|nr:hypothetical protein [Flavobacterium sp. IMCC34518]
MKRLLVLLSLSLAHSISFGQTIWDKSNCEKCSENQFTFDKVTILKLEKDPSFNKFDNQIYKYNLSLGAMIIKNENDDESLGKYIKLSDIPSTDKFILIGDSFKNVLIQNVKTKLFYVTNSASFNYMDYSKSDENGFKTLIKHVPKALTVNEQELLNRYKSLIKSGQANANVLKSIQIKCMTRGYFDPQKMNKTHKQIWNKNILALKSKADKLSDIKYEDTDNKALDKLTMSELGSIHNINQWDSNFSTIE